MAENAPVAGTPAVRAVLCDLDDTLFDHAHATSHALTQVADVERALACWPMEELISRHNEVLEVLHRRVLDGELTVDVARLERFTRLLDAAGVADAAARANDVAATYRAAYEAGWRAVPGALELVTALADAGVPLVIVTNNGVAEQRLKLARTGLAAGVRALVTSEEVGSAKPHGAIFRAALARAGVPAESAVMVGDSWAADVLGARAAGIRAVWFNRAGVDPPDADVEVLETLAPAEAVVSRLLGGERSEVRGQK